MVVKEEETVEGRAVTKGEMTSAIYRLGHFLSLRQIGERVFSDLRQGLGDFAKILKKNRLFC